MRTSMRLLAVGLTFVCGASCQPAGSDAAPAETDRLYSGAYTMVENWITGAPADIEGTSAATVDAQGRVYAFRRFDAGNPNGGNVWIIDRDGKFVEAWGQDIARWTHGIRVDPEGNIWTVDGRGHTIKKWSPDHSQLLMTLGKDSVSGTTSDTFNRPTDIAFAPNGDFFISDGYGNKRVVKFDKDGTFIKEWGGHEGDFNTVHSIAIDRRNRVLVADRDNARIQLFDLDGNFIEQWTHLGSPNALTITGDDRLYVSDDIMERIWIVDAATGDLLGTIEKTPSPHWVTADQEGNVYVSSNQFHYLRKYSRGSR
jgi:DNA-binding beta-propeller fold protein YncE